MDPYSVLIVDDDINWTKNLSDIITLYAEALTGDKALRLSIRTASTQKEADAQLFTAPERGYDIIVVDREYPKETDAIAVKEIGDAWLPVVRLQQPNAVIAVATRFPDVEQIVHAIRDVGADDYISKTLAPKEIFNRLLAACEYRKRMIRSRMPYQSNVLRTSAEDIHLAFSKAGARLRTLPIANDVDDVFRDLQTSLERISSRFQGSPSISEKELRAVDLQATINQELPYFEDQLPKARFRLKVDSSRIVTTYESDFRDALREVLQNAVDALDEMETYSPNPVTVVVRSAGIFGHIQIQVSDEGPGFSDRAIQTLCQPGVSWWTRNPSRHKGMGLYVAKRMMQAVGGDISYAGPQEQGSTVVLSLRDWGAA